VQRDGGPGGAGGAGNPVGGSFTGPAQALDIYGDFAAAYSGEIVATGSTGGATVKMLDFTSGNYLFVGFLNFSNDMDGASVISLAMELNGNNVLVMSEDNSATDTPMRYNIIIPAYTEVSVKWGVSSGTDVKATAILTGRIYRG